MPNDHKATAENAHIASDEALGLREADCGCCYVVDMVALNELRAAVSSR